MTSRITNRAIYYSEDHCRALMGWAIRASRRLRATGRYIQPEELAAEGWLRAARTCPPNALRIAARYTICHMLHYGMNAYRSYPEYQSSAVASPDHFAQVHDACERIRARVDPGLWEVGWRVYGLGESMPEVGRRLCMTRGGVRYRLKRFTQEARRCCTA